MNLQLRTPDNSFRPWPLFVLNEDYDDAAGLERLMRGLEDVARAGFGGVFLHPRPGLLTEYLSPRWFEVIEALVRKCLELGLVPGLYDENSYPSGCAGGHTCSRRPETRARYLTPEFGEGTRLPEGNVAAYRYEAGEVGERIEEAEAHCAWVAFREAEAKVLAWHGEVAAPNLLDPLTTQTFLECTHEAYKRHLPKDVFRAIPAMFTDEPHLIADRHGPMGSGLPITPDFVVRFRLAHGYNILDHLPELYFDTGDYEAIRFDFYDFSHRIWVESWAEPMEAWHKENGWKLTGHYLEHNWPVPYATPGQMELLAHMDWPGTDLLLADALAGHEHADLQNFGPSEAGTEPHLLFVLRQTQSVANQFGKERVMNESWGAGGNASTPADWLRMGRFLIVNGVNLLVPHHAMTSIRGTRKHDHPQFFSVQSPWFEYLPELNDELARSCQAISNGKMCNRILVLDAQTAGYCLARKSDCIDATPPDPFSPGGVRAGEGPLADLRDATIRTVQALVEAQCDFDIGDEYLLAKHGECGSDGRLNLGEQTYDVLVWPEGLFNLRTESADMIEGFLQSGGVIVGVRPGRFLENGRSSARLDEWEKRYATQLRWTATEEVVVETCRHVPPRIEAVDTSNGIYHQRRETSEGVLWYVINVSDEVRRVRFLKDVPTCRMDPRSGESFSNNGDELELPPHSSLLLSDVQPSTMREPEEVLSFPDEGGVEMEVDKIEALGCNALVLDRCELSLFGEAHAAMETRRANSMVWKEYGLSAAGASGTIQYRRQILDRAACLPASSGYAVTFTFELGSDVDLSDIRLAVETPELFEVSLNGVVLDYSEAQQWLDPNIYALPVAEHLRKGTNSVKLVQSPFDPRAEVAPIYVLGDFSLASTDSGFRIEPEEEWELGSWSAQGRPFFDREVVYEFKSVPQSGNILLKRSAWGGSWIIAECGSCRRQLTTDEDLLLPVKQGANLRLTVVGLPQNLLGPWHPGDSIRRAGKFGCALHWEAPFARIDPCPGSEYDFLELGLFAPPTFVPIAQS